jgi:GNAT superfamily N-acetyltransferase
MYIRNAIPSDAPAIANLSSQLGYPVEVRTIEESIPQFEHNENQVVYIAEDDGGSAVGWIHVFIAERLFVPSFAEIGGLIVDEKWRGKGVGKKLLDEAEKWGLQNGCSKMLIRSNVIRERAHEFYSGAGYQMLKKQSVFQKDLRGRESP